MLLTRLKTFLNPFDGRYEDMLNPQWYKCAFRDFTAGLIVAMVAIPLAMGFAMASGLRPEHGIVGGAIAGLIGALFGGSKYQVYGPTAAFIPVIAGVMYVYGGTAATYDQGHGFLVLMSLCAGGLLMLMGLFGFGRFVTLVPHSIVVGFTIGIAATIALSQIGEVLGLKTPIKGSYTFLEKLEVIGNSLGEFNVYALILAVGTFLITKYLLKVSVYIPAPLIALGVCTALVTFVWHDQGLTTVFDKYGPIPSNLLVFTPPAFPDPATIAAEDRWSTSLLVTLTGGAWSAGMAQLVLDLVYFAVAIIFVSAVESLLCSRMADRLAGNTGQPFNPNKELWGQGWVQVVAPLINGFPHTGALARTATNIKLGAVTPLAGICKCVLKLLLAAYLATYLQQVPMACIGGILAFVAFNMVKPAEVREAIAHGWKHVLLMAYTAVAVIFTDFLTGVLTAIVIYGVFFKFFDAPTPARLGADDAAAPDEGEEIERNGDAHTNYAPTGTVRVGAGGSP